MNDLKLDSNHDIIIQDKDLVLINNEPDMSKQSVVINLRFWRGEWWLDLTRGVPYLQELLRKGVDKVFVDTVIKDAIRDSYNIQSINEFESEVSGRKYTLTRFRATCLNGEIISLTNVGV